MKFDYDLFVIGAGSAGVRSSRLAGAMGKKVAICENSLVGGTCVIRGCVPKKLMVYGAEYHNHMIDAKAYGWDIDVKGFDWDHLKKIRDQEVMRLNGLYKKTLANNHVELIEGEGKFVDPHTVQVNGKNYTAQHILIAVGGIPSHPLIEGIEHSLSSNEIFHLPKLPKKLVIGGGGFIALEFAGIFNRLGVDVSMIIRRQHVLRGFDPDIQKIVTEAQEKHGIKIYHQREVKKIEQMDDHNKKITLDDGTLLEADVFLAAYGRQPNLENLNLKDAGVELDSKGFIKVDAHYRTTQAHIGAAGDVIPTPALTPVALREAMAWLETIYHNNPQSVDDEFLATSVFSVPEVGTVGYGEDAAKEKFGDENIDIYMTHFKPMIHTLSGRDEKIMMKLVVHQKTDRVLGVHMVGEHAGETVQGLAIALTAGATKADFDSTIGIHPTAAEEFTTLREPV